MVFNFSSKFRVGLAASLQQRVIAQMKIKEERDVERQKRAEINPMHNGSVTITPTAHIKTEGNWEFSQKKSHFLLIWIWISIKNSSQWIETYIANDAASSAGQNSSTLRQPHER